MSRKVLVVDDEKLIVKGIRFSLEQDGMDVDCAYDGEEALKLIRENKYNIILLDVMLPKLDGFQVCQQVREFSDVPIVMLTAKGEDMDKILGLEYGADDYITKPFNILEVKARIKAIMRRTERQTEERPEGRHDFEPFAFRINDNALPELIEGYRPEAKKPGRPEEEKFDPYRHITEQQHRIALEAAFGLKEEYGYKDLETALIKAYMSVGVKLNHQKAVSLITMLRNKRMIVQENGRKYTFKPDFHY